MFTSAQQKKTAKKHKTQIELITFIHVYNKRITNECRSVVFFSLAPIPIEHASLVIKIKSNDLQQNASI